ncbi:DUF2089 family protein [Roseibium salinum]|uniref:DUF2089 family protein n=1 Tax=Roseibium salinum TaxID=1604349 RepID=A0ABT3QVF9_9HYPH|nr:DUF2089 family protein [Roseibium sp. DSM 29163]MCX2720913.1 DUF2089 family protein [Roseibium sp. DSM 29163]MDN3722350.1 DUF2089 family protein [Roseibium salinum]
MSSFACTQCGSSLAITQLCCPRCEITYSGVFALPRLMRLEGDDQRLVERIILSGCNLKDVAASMEISYPTLRKRLDALIDRLNSLREQDEERTNAILDDVKAGKTMPEAAARQIREMNGGT